MATGPRPRPCCSTFCSPSIGPADPSTGGSSRTRGRGLKSHSMRPTPAKPISGGAAAGVQPKPCRARRALNHQIPAIPFLAETRDVHPAGRERYVGRDAQTQRRIQADLGIDRDGLTTRTRHVPTIKARMRSPAQGCEPVPWVRKDPGAGLAFRQSRKSKAGKTKAKSSRGKFLPCLSEPSNQRVAQSVSRWVRAAHSRSFTAFFSLRSRGVCGSGAAFCCGWGIFPNPRQVPARCGLADACLSRSWEMFRAKRITFKIVARQRPRMDETPQIN